MRVKHSFEISKGVRFGVWAEHENGERNEVIGVALKDLKLILKENKPSFLQRLLHVKPTLLKLPSDFRFSSDLWREEVSDFMTEGQK